MESSLRTAQLIEDAWNAVDLPTGGIATVGNFDGLHVGQQALLKRVVERARASDGPALVISFDPHPLHVLNPGAVPPRLATRRQRRRLLGELGVDALLLIDFTEEFSRTPAEDFVADFLHGRLQVKELYVGRGFRFGYRRGGDVTLLRRLGKRLGFDTTGFEEVRFRGQILSSTRIREAVAEGAMEKASEMLGRPYGVEGEVVQGERMGKRLGWPTINVEPHNELLPADGVYACRVFFPSFPACFECVANIGTRPTVYEHHERVLEAHVLDFAADVYGEEVEIRFYNRLREERIFSTVMDLSAQISQDVEATREYFRRQEHLKEGVGASIGK